MTYHLRQSTASQEVPLGYFLDSTDGDTEETGLTISNTDIKIHKAGATTLANKNSGGATHISNGVYYAVLDATDTNTLGPLVIFIHESGALPVRIECAVLPSNVYDSLYSTDKLQVDATQIEGSDATDQINAACDAALADYDAPTKAELDSGLAGLNDLTAAQVNAEVDTALADYDPPTKAELDAAVANVSVDEIQATALADLFNTDSGTVYGSAVSGSVVAEIADNAGGTSLTEAGIADAVWDEAITGHTGAGSFGEAVDDAVKAADLPTNFSSLVISGAGNVDALVQGYLNNLITESTAGRIAANFDTFFENADAVTSSVVDDVGGGSGGLTQQQVADALKLAPTAGTPAAGSVNAHLDEIIVDTDTTIPGLIGDLNDFDPANDTVVNVTNVGTCSSNSDMRGTDSAFLAASAPTNFSDLAITATTGRVDINTNNDKTGYFINGSITSLDGLNNISAAQVNAEVIDVLMTDTVTEASGVPAANASIGDKLNFVFAMVRNKSTQTSTTFTLRNDADSGDIASQTVSDNGTTFTRTEMS